MVTNDTNKQKLINIQSRGGLTAVIEDVNKLFVCAEELFRSDTSKKGQRIEINSMIEQLICNTKFMANFYAIVDAAQLSNMEQDLKQKVLISILKLYLKVRAFSYSRDIVAKHKLKLSEKISNKHGLRKSLQEATCSGKHAVDYEKTQ